MHSGNMSSVDYEINMIKQMGFEGYFMIVWISLNMPKSMISLLALTWFGSWFTRYVSSNH
jgi:hypothetical protein